MDGEFGATEVMVYVSCVMGDFREYSPCLQSQVLKVTRDHPPGSYRFVLSFQGSLLRLLPYCFHLFHYYFFGGGGALSV